MFVRDYMTRNVTTLPDDARLIDAALLIRRTGKRHVPIVSAKNGKLVGIISDRDVSRLAPSVLTTHDQEEYNRVFESTPIAQAMTKDPITVAVGATVLEAVQLLYEKKISGLCVMDGDSLQGIITVTDMLAVLIEMLGGSKSTAMMSSGD
jgi:acetoin utilization protein AcuB